jgi:TonB family protein
MRLGISAVPAVVLLAVLPACAQRPAQEPPPPKPTAEEMGWLVPGLSAAGNSFILAWNRHDPHALAALWHEDGDFVDASGRAARGRKRIEALFRDELGTSRLELLSGATERPLGRDVRLEDWDVEVTGMPRSVSFVSPARLHLVLAYSRRPPGGWLLASARAYAFQGFEVFDDMSEHGTPLRPGGEVTRPVPISTPPPAYTVAARRVGIEGVVILEAVIDQEGLVTSTHVLKPLPFGLDAKAREAVERWRFQPATLHGRRVEVYDTLTVRFSLPHEVGDGGGSAP